MNSDKFFLTQDKIYDFIFRYIKDTGYSPTVREICMALDIKSTSTVSLHLKKLHERGLIDKKNGTCRSLTIDNPTRSVSVPLVGQVAAGIPILAEENVEEFIDIPQSIFFEKELFMLTVKGDSMINIGIFDGDKVVVKSQSEVNNGEVAVVLVDKDTATVKRYYLEEDCVRLKAENPDYPDIICRQATVLGKVVGLIRRI